MPRWLEHHPKWSVGSTSIIAGGLVLLILRRRRLGIATLVVGAVCASVLLACDCGYND